MANNINPSVPQENPIDISDKYSDIKLNIADTFNRINNTLDIIILYNFPSGNTGGGSNNNGSNNGSNGRPKPKKPAQHRKPYNPFIGLDKLRRYIDKKVEAAINWILK